MSRYDPEATRSKILDAAESEFLARGYAGASIGAIAKRADVSKGLIVHHFGAKDALWQAAFERLFATLTAVRAEAGAANAAASFALDEASLAADVANYFRFARENPKFVRLLAWAIIDNAAMKNPVGDALLQYEVARISAAQKAGTVRKDLDPALIAAAAISCADYWLLARDSFVACGLFNAKKADDASMIDTLAKIFSRGLRPDGSPTKGSSK